MSLIPMGCVTVPDSIAFSEPIEAASVQNVFVASSRLPAPVSVDASQDRETELKYARYDVSIPPTHALGQIEWPDAEPDANTDFVVVGEQDFASESELLAAIRKERDDEILVFIHGYNNTSSEALYRFAQVGHDFQTPTPMLLFAWPSAGQPQGYVYDLSSVSFSRDPLADLLTEISRKTNKKIALIAHSMGSHLAMEVMRQLALTGRRDVLNDLDVVALLSPDIDPDVFRSQATVIGELPDPFVIMTSQNDRALSLSAFLNVGRQRVGNLTEAEDVEGFDITIFDFSAVADGSSGDHLVPFTSPAAIALMRNVVKTDERGEPDLSEFTIGADGVVRANPPDTTAPTQ
ncbi:MAG: alpha/beta fold hydrolase [Pseudomonadota bacterium]